MSKLILKTLKSRKDFLKVVKNGRKFFLNDAAVIVCNRPVTMVELILEGTGNIEITYAVTVSKKTSKKAVIRNRIKRLLRQSLNEMFKETGVNDNLLYLEYIILSWRKAPAHPKLIRLNDVKPVVVQILTQACDYYAGRIKFHQGKE